MGIESTRITSEALQSAIRQLLPSQVGFGDDLHATNLIQPIIDLTATAEGSSLPVSLQQAIAFGNVTAFNVANTTSTLVSNTGFYRIFGAVSDRSPASGASSTVMTFQLTDGVSTKIIYKIQHGDAAQVTATTNDFDFIVFIGTGESLTATTNSANMVIGGASRQVATINGTLVNPIGFTAE